jgi:hypothetical protein
MKQVTVLPWCYRGVTVMLQWCYSGVTVVLQWCRTWSVPVTVSGSRARHETGTNTIVTSFGHHCVTIVTPLWHNYDTIVSLLSLCHYCDAIVTPLYEVFWSQYLALEKDMKQVTVLTWCYRGVTLMLHWRYSGVTVVFQWCRTWSPPVTVSGSRARHETGKILVMVMLMVLVMSKKWESLINTVAKHLCHHSDTVLTHFFLRWDWWKTHCRESSRGSCSTHRKCGGYRWKSQRASPCTCTHMNAWSWQPSTWCVNTHTHIHAHAHTHTHTHTHTHRQCTHIRRDTQTHKHTHTHTHTHTLAHTFTHTGTSTHTHTHAHTHTQDGGNLTPQHRGNTPKSPL